MTAATDRLAMGAPVPQRGTRRDGGRLVASNAALLLALQLTNYVFPLLLVPYLTRTTGIATYGVIAFGVSATQLAAVISDFGFNLSATARVARARDSDLPHLFSAVLWAKLPLGVLVSVALLAVPRLIADYEPYSGYFTWLAVGAFAQAFGTFWFFQGLERMGLIAGYTVVTRLSYLVGVLALVRDSTDVTHVGVAFAVSQLLGVAVALPLAARHGGRFTRVSLVEVLAIVRESAPFFSSRAAVATYSIGGVLVIGLVGDPRHVAYYATADQVYRAGQVLFNPLGQALYPSMARELDARLFARALKAVLGAAAVVTVVGWLGGPLVLDVLLAESPAPAVATLAILYGALMFAAPSILLGYPLLGALGRVRYANYSVFIGAAVQITLLTVMLLTDRVSAPTVAASMLVCEAVVATTRALWARRGWAEAVAGADHHMGTRVAVQTDRSPGAEGRASQGRVSDGQAAYTKRKKSPC